MIQRHSKWRIALIASLSMILTSTAATSTDQKARVLLGHPTSKEYAVPSIRKSAAGLKKTDFVEGQDEVSGSGKTIDYTLYNYGGSAVLSLTKDKSSSLGFNDTQASTIAALGNAALILGGALLFGQLNNRIQEKAAENLYARGFKGHPMGMIAPPALKPIPTFRKRRLRNRFRKRRLPAYIKTTYSQRHGRLPVGGRRRLRKNFQTRGRRPARRPVGHLKNHRISAEYAKYPGAMTRDQVSVPLREVEPTQTYTPQTYKSDASVLDPIKPMLYNDPYLQYEEQPSSAYEDYYYDDYYDAAIPNFSALKGDTPNQIQAKPAPEYRALPAKTYTKQPTIKTTQPVLNTNDIYTEPRIPTRNEMLLKMSEEKRLEKLQKERAKLLEATLMRPEEMMSSEPAPTPASTTNQPQSPPSFGFSQETPSAEPNYGFLPETRKPMKTIPIRNRARVPLKTRQRQRQPLAQAQEFDMDMPSFESPRAAFQTTFARPTPSVISPVSKNTEEAPAAGREDQAFYSNFKNAENDPFQDIASEFGANNEDWISTISQAFEGFSDFKKLK